MLTLIFTISLILGLLAIPRERRELPTDGDGRWRLRKGANGRIKNPYVATAPVLRAMGCG